MLFTFNKRHFGRFRTTSLAFACHVLHVAVLGSFEEVGVEGFRDPTLKIDCGFLARFSLECKVSPTIEIQDIVGLESRI